MTGEYPYVYIDGIYLKRCWSGEIQNVSVLVAIGVNKDGFREILGAAEGMKEDKESWLNVFTVTPKTKMKQVTLMLKAIHAQESKEAAQERCIS